MEESSLLWWWPRLRFAAVPKPQTMIVWTGWHTLIGLPDGNRLPMETRVLVEAAASHLGYPLFMRTDLCSCKHEWGLATAL